jgi:hypothetical protein
MVTLWLMGLMMQRQAVLRSHLQQPVQTLQPVQTQAHQLNLESKRLWLLQLR